MKSRTLLCCLVLLLPVALVATGCPSSSSGCPVGQSKCDGVCIDTTADRDNCGLCANNCLDGQFCAAGVCVPCQNECMMGDSQCVAGTTTQYQVCGDPDQDTCLEWAPAQSCGTGQTCSDGDCVTTCTNECSGEDDQVCDLGGANGYRVCGDYDDDSCLELGDLVPCGVGYTCVDGQCAEACVDECPADGNRTCAAPPDNGFLTCGNFDGDTCLEWGSLTLCPQGETCSAGACSSNCNDDCAAGDRICEGNAYRTCGSFDADPCLDWSSLTNCAGYELCTDGTCEIACQDDCASGAKRCNGDNTAFEVCGNYDADPCLEFGNLTTCGAGDICENGNCVEDCRDECPNNGARICDGDGYRTCRANVDADSCLEWSDITSCPQDQSCIGGDCSDVCITECSENDRECSGNGWRECTAVPDPQDPGQDCWVWGTVTACNPYYACDPSTAQCVLTCSDECPAGGARQCTGDLTGYQECAAGYDADPCLEWGAPVACAQFYECDPGSAQCVLSCSDDCLPAGSMRCNGDGTGTQECGNYDADPCQEWGNDTPCQSGWTCSGATCSPSCTDDCASDGLIVCSNLDPTHKTYQICGQYDGDACLDLSTPLTCGYGEQCDDQEPSGCATVCTDECATLGALQCNGSNVEICVDDFDADECTEWGVQTACDPATQLCYNGACLSTTPPSVVLINEFIYDSQGTDTDPGNFLYIELYGTPGQSLNGYSVVGINGNGGSQYMTIPLAGYSIPADGFFVITRPNADAGLLAEADLQVNFDPQNGPDNLQVLWAGSVVVDAVGYETFSASDYWAGEGADYNDAAPSGDMADGIVYCLSRSADHRDDNVNWSDFYRRTLNNCSPGWEGPGRIFSQAYLYGGTSKPAFDVDGYAWTVDSTGWVNVTRNDLADADDVSPAASFISSVAVDQGTTPNIAYVGSNNGVYGYTLNVDQVDPFTVSLNQVFGPVVTGQTVRATPAIGPTDGAVFFGTEADGFYGYNADASERFRYESGDWAGSIPPIDSSAVIAYKANGDELVIFGVGGDAGELIALYSNASNLDGQPAGAEFWRIIGFGGGCTSSPAVVDGMVFIGCDDGGLWGFDLETGAMLDGFGVGVVGDGSSGITDVDACSPVVIPDGQGGYQITMSSRSPDGNLFFLNYDGSDVTGGGYAFPNLLSSAAYGADGSSTVHVGRFLANFAYDGTLQWDAVVGASEPTDNWILSSPTWISAGSGVGLILVVEPGFSGNLWVVDAAAEPAAFGHPQLHVNWANTGWPW